MVVGLDGVEPSPPHYCELLSSVVRNLRDRATARCIRTLPVYDTVFVMKLVRSAGFEPATSGTANRHSIQLSYERAITDLL